MRKQRSSFLFFLAVCFVLLAFASFASASHVLLLAHNHSVVSSVAAESPPAAVLDETNLIMLTMISEANCTAGVQESTNAYVTGVTSVENLARKHDQNTQYMTSGAPRMRTATRDSYPGFV